MLTKKFKQNILEYRMLNCMALAIIRIFPLNETIHPLLSWSIERSYSKTGLLSQISNDILKSKKHYLLMEQPCIPHIMYTKSCSFVCVNNIACSGIRKLKVDWVFMYHEWGWLRLRPARRVHTLMCYIQAGQGRAQCRQTRRPSV